MKSKKRKQREKKWRCIELDKPLKRCLEVKEMHLNKLNREYGSLKNQSQNISLDP